MKVPTFIASFMFCGMWVPSCCSWFGNQTARDKRIVYGEDIPDRNAPYSVIKYYVWIGDGHNCELGNVWGKLNHYLFDAQCTPNKDNLVCGGALIAPRFVATAAHCITKKKLDRDEWSYFHTLNVFTDRYEIYMGYNDVNDFTAFERTAGYMVHADYKQMAHHPYHSTYDFGLIVTMLSMYDSNLKWYDIAYAPAYTREDMKTIYDLVTNKEYLCIIVGFGPIDKDVIEGSSYESRAVMRHGWVTTMNYEVCYYSQLGQYGDALDIYTWPEFASWVCQKNFGKLGAMPEAGDSGSPVTCNNEYFAQIASGMWTIIDSEISPEFIQHNEAIYNAENQYCAEKRRAFDEALEKYAQDQRDRFDEWFEGIRTPSEDLRALNPKSYKDWESVKVIPTSGMQCFVPWHWSALAFVVSCSLHQQ